MTQDNAVFLVRPAVKKDLLAISKIFKTEYAKQPYNEKWSKVSALKKIKEYFEKEKIFVAETEKKVCGFVVYSVFLWYDGRRGLIEEICIEKNYQRKGIGKKLVLQVEEFLKKNGIKKLDLRASNKAFAFDFYKKHGFKENGLVCLTKKIA